MAPTRPAWMKACAFCLSFALAANLVPTYVFAAESQQGEQQATAEATEIPVAQPSGEADEAEGTSTVTNHVDVYNTTKTIDGSIDTSDTLDEYQGYALKVYASTTDANATVTGGVTGHTVGSGVDAVSVTAKNGKTATANVGSNVTADNNNQNRNDNGAGVHAVTYGSESTINVDVVGDVSCDGFYADGIDVFMNEGTTTISTGDVFTNGSYETYGIDISTYIYPSGESSGPANSGTVRITTGNITVVGAAGDGRNGAAFGIRSQENAGDLTIVAKGDVSVSSDTGNHEQVGVFLNGDEGSTNTIAIDGTLSARDAAVVNNVFGGGQVDITVWKVEYGHHFVVRDWLDGYQEDEETAANINYIIKIEQPSVGDVLAAKNSLLGELAKNTDLDREVAKEGEKVYLTLTDQGYYIKAAYNGQGDKVALQQDDNGWYVVVPRGGGVWLSAELGKNSYKVTFEDEDGTMLQTGLVEYLDTPAYEGDTPTKEATVSTVYKFDGWNPEINPVTGEITYTATYKASPRSYDISYNLAGGTLYGATGVVTNSCVYGSELTMPLPEREGYTFLYWEGSRYDAGDSYIVEGDHTFTAVWEKNPEKNDNQETTKQASTSTGSSQATTALPQTSDTSARPVSIALAAAAGLACLLAGTSLGRRRERHGRHLSRL